MSRVPKAIIALGLLVVAMGFIVVLDYSSTQQQAEAAGAGNSLTGSLEALDYWIQWMSSSYKLMIANLFVSGSAIALSGYSLHRQNSLQK